MGEGLLEYNVNLVRQQLATILIITFCGVTILFSFLNLLLHLSFSWLRQKSGGTIFFIITSEMLLVLCIMFSTIFFQDFNPIFYHYPGSQSQSRGCDTLAGFNTYFFFLSRMYSACISHELQLVIQNPTYSSKQWHACYHLASNLVSIIFLIILITTDNIGMSSTLLCWNRYTPETLTNNIVITVFLVALIVFTIFNLYFLFRKAPKVLKKEFKGYMIRYSAYLIAEIIVDLINVFQMFFACLNNQYFSRGQEYSHYKRDGYSGLRYFSGASNLFIPLFMTLLRLTDPQVRRIIRESICRRKTRETVNALERIPTDPHASFIELQNKGKGTYLSKESTLTQSSLTRTQTRVSSQDHTVKEQSVYISINTILTGICYSLQQADSEGFGEEMMNIEEEVSPHPKYFKQKFTSILNRKKSLKEVYRNDVMSTQNRNYDIKIKQYAPGIFQHLRLVDELEPAELVTALSPGNNEQNLQNFMAGAGKSNAFFFFTQDLNFAIKTINREEFNTLMQRLLPKYYSHILEHPDSLLARILGVFSVRASHMNKIYIMIMRNLLGKDKPFIKRIYDLKGSTYKRSALDRTNSQLRNNSGHNSAPPPPNKVLKDLDLLKFQEWICLSERLKKKIINTLTLDSEMLRSCNLMDYSLLVARFEIPSRTKETAREQEARIHREKEMRSTKRYKTVTYLKNIARNEQLNVRVNSPQHSLKTPLNSFFDFNMADNIVEAEKEKVDPHRFPHPKKCKIVYSISIIDFLQNYNFRKQMEYQGRKLAHPRVSPDTLSVQNPHAYGDRFVRFMERVVKTPEEIEKLPMDQEEQQHPKSAGHKTVH